MASDALTIATSINYSRQALKQLNNLTYLFNPNWSEMGDARAGNNTLPMALIHMIKMEEILTSQVSSQQLILYRAPGGKESEANKAQLGVVADNIINQPKRYSIECLVPRTYSSLMNSTFNAGIYDPGIIAMTYEDFTASQNNAVIATALTAVQASMSIANVAITVLRNLVGQLTNLASIVQRGNPQDYISMVLNGTSYNKDSLEAMWLSRAILKLKVPDSWKYKTVVITDCNISKVGTEDDVYRATMTVQEVPMITAGYYQARDSQIESNLKPTVMLGKALQKALSVMESTD